MFTGNGQLCTEDDLLAWEHDADPGYVLTYYTGPSLARSLALSPHRMEDIVNRVRGLYNQGRIELIQCRIGHDDHDRIFAYRAFFRHHNAKRQVHERLPMVGELI